MFHSRFFQLTIASCLLFAAADTALPCPKTPNLSSFNSSVLPDLFTFLDGRTKVRTLEEWACRRAEMSTLLQKDELGVLPGPPDSMSASFSGNTLTINVTHAGKSITFAPTITFPANSTGRVPAIIGMGGVSVPVPEEVAVIVFDNSGFAQQDSSPASRGVGLFYDLFGTDASAGAMMAWAWGVQRIIDALEVTPAARINLDKVGVSGCSRNGKGALVAGAFEPRIALTIPQESGSGGTDSWRISDFILSTGILTQTASEIVQENVWLSANFDRFANTSVDGLPFDHHSLGALVAPRAMFVIDNLGYDWLGPFSSWGAMIAARTAWTALGASENMGISQAANHTHCVFPDTQQPQLTAFFNKFLLDTPADTHVVETAGNYTFSVPNAQWAPWHVPIFV